MKYGLVAAALLCVPALAAAQSSKAYMALQVGASLLQNADNSANGVTVSSDYNTGYTAAFRVGDRIDRHWRGEWEIAYASNDVSQLTLNKAVSNFKAGVHGDVSGSEAAITGTANILYDFTPGRAFHPYIGVGIGITRLSMQDITAKNVSAQNVTIVNDSTVAFAYQGIAGIELDITPTTAVYFDYHYLAAVNPRFTDTAGYDFSSAYKSNNFSLGLRYFF